MFPGSDPIAPVSSRFPLSPAGGRIPISGSGSTTSRPFGLTFAVIPKSREMGQHDKKETRTTKTRATNTTSDGQNEGAKPDTETYVEITYE